MVTAIHSKDSRIYLDDGDLSGASSSLEIPESRVLSDKTGFGDAGRRYHDAPTEDTISWEGLFDNAASPNGVDEELQALLGSEVVGTFWPGGDAIGKIGRGSPTVIGRTHTNSTRVVDMVLARATMEANATLERIKALQAKDAAAITATEIGVARIDDGAGTSNGGAWYHHVFAITAVGGNTQWTLELQHSANDSTWVTKDSVNISDSATGAARRAITGTFDRYVRQRRVLDATSGTLISHISFIRTP